MRFSPKKPDLAGRRSSAGHRHPPTQYCQSRRSGSKGPEAAVRGHWSARGGWASIPGVSDGEQGVCICLEPSHWVLFSTMWSIPVHRAGTKDQTNTRHGSQQCGCPRPEGWKVLKSTPSQGAAKPELRHRGWASSRKFPPLQCLLWKIPRGIQGCRGSPGSMVWVGWGPMGTGRGRCQEQGKEAALWVLLEDRTTSWNWIPPLAR